MIRLKKCWWVFLLLLLCVPQLSFAAEKEPMYQITESELTKLEQNLTELSNLNVSQSKTLEMQKIQLKTSEEKLQTAEKKSVQLTNQLKNLDCKMTEQEKLLQTANQSFEEFVKEERDKENKLKRERNIGYWLAGILAVVCIAK